MDPSSDQTSAARRSAAAWQLARSQHWAVASRQLRALGFRPDAIRHRLRVGRLHPTRWRGVYAVGRVELTRSGTWMAAILACGDGAVLSHRSAAELWGLLPAPHPRRRTVDRRSTVAVDIEVSVPPGRRRRLGGIAVYRRVNLGPREVTSHRRIPVTTPVRTILDFATGCPPAALERAINEADKRDLVDPEALRGALDERAGEPGVAIVRRLLDRRTFTLTDSELERRFLPLVREAGLPAPLTQQSVSGHRVDFHWPDLGLVVETDGLRYHRTAAQQTADRRRDQAHAAAGLTPLRFSHAQVEFERSQVRATLERVGRRLMARPRAPERRRRAG